MTGNIIIDERTTLHLADLRTAAALVREGDWRRIAIIFDQSKFKPLAFLAWACAEQLALVSQHDLEARHICGLCKPEHRAAIVELMEIFGVGT